MNNATARTLPVPREGITGTERTDWLLELDTDAIPHRDALGAMAYHLIRASLVGNPAPITKKIYNRVSSPQVGDLVVEQSVMYRGGEDDRLKGFGILLAHREEWAETDEQYATWVAEEPYWSSVQERSVVDAWYIQYGNAPVDVCRWTNSDFYAIPTSIDEFRA